MKCSCLSVEFSVKNRNYRFHISEYLEGRCHGEDTRQIWDCLIFNIQHVTNFCYLILLVASMFFFFQISVDDLRIKHSNN